MSDTSTQDSAAADELLSPEAIAAAREIASGVEDGLNRVLLGQEELVRGVLVAVLARGHVLLEGLPGLGKTELVKGLAGALGLAWRRVQFTPDLLPGDITGGPVLEEDERGRRTFTFRKGPVFTQLLLADEINRASPKTQSALLEAMAERSVSVLGETHRLPEPFLVVATQNPIELEGTYPLPEAQLDRFLFRLEVPSPPSEALEAILTQRRGGRPPALDALVDEAGLAQLFDAVDAVFLPRAVARYVARLVEASHPSSAAAPETVRGAVRHGGSPRAAIALAEAGRARALLCGKPNVGFDDVRALALPVLGHRLVLDYRARLDGIGPRHVVDALLEGVAELEGDLPGPAERGA